MRKTLSILIGIAAFIGIIVGILYTLGADKSVSETIEHSRSIEESFQKVIAFVETQKKATGRLPTLDEFNSWVSQFSPNQVFSPKGIRLVDRSFPQEAVEKFGTPPLGSYLLVFWRGEWNEYYTSWANKSTLHFDPKRYHALGSGVADGVVITICSFLFLLLAIKIWPNHLFQRTAKSRDR